MKNRYANLDLEIDRTNPVSPHLNFMEIGTYDGVRAAGLIQRWLTRKPGAAEVHYFGFDLWEDLTPEMSKAELSKTKLPPSLEQVQQRFDLIPRCKAHLFKGNTRETIPAKIDRKLLPMQDLIFVDGGHSLETIKSDWESVKRLCWPTTVVLFDDYYENRDDYGCKTLIKSLNRSQWKIELLDPVDVIPGNGLLIRMVKVTPAVT